jgi:hypothetical protein
MTIRWGGLLLLNSPNIGWGSPSPRQQVGKAIDLNRMTEHDYSVRCVNAFAMALPHDQTQSVPHAH